MKKNILILLSDPNSINYEIIKKSINFFKKKNKKNEYFFVGDKKDFHKKVNENSNLNFINIKKGKNIKKYLEKCFLKTFKILKEKKAHGLINLPLNKKYLPKKFPGFTEYISNYFEKRDKETMLLFNEKFSVCPNTTHIPINKVSAKITKKKIINNALNINLFYKNIISLKKPKIYMMGLNPHSGVDFNHATEEKKILIPAIRSLKLKKVNIQGLFSPDTAFCEIKKNKINCLMGNYHDQVLPTFKYIFKYNAINITLGLPFIRISPDHGVAKNIIGKNIANPQSFLYALNFFEKFHKKI